MTPVQALDLASVFVFALTGALTASRAQLDIVGFVFIACLTAVGGGTIRDLLLGRVPVFWIERPDYVLLATVAAVLVFFTAHLIESRIAAIRWLDACALAVAVAAGAGVAIDQGHGVVIITLMGVATGCLGGLMRDVVCNEVPLVLKQGELYVTAAFAGGATAAIATTLLEIPLASALLLCAGVTWALRAGSLAFGWRLPVYKSRPPRR